MFYRAVMVGEQCWMAENLNVGTMIPGGATATNNGVIEKYCYNNLESNCAIYGGLYQWDEVMVYNAPSVTNPSGVQGICPDGWHMPSYSEISQLTNELGMGTAGGLLKEKGFSHWLKPNTGATNAFSFTSRGSGNYFTDIAAFSHINERANYWSTTTFYYFPKPSLRLAWCMMHTNGSAGQTHWYQSADKMSHGVRCVKDNNNP